MGVKFSLSGRQLFLGTVLIIVLTAAFTLTIFWLGQQSAINASRPGNTGEPLLGSEGSQTSPDVSPQSTLPRAMTATPKTRSAEQVVLTEEQATQLVLDQIQVTGSESLFKADGVTFSQDSVIINGLIDYLGYNGPLELVGEPLVDSAKLQFRLTSAKLNGQELPQFLYPTIEMEINALFERAFIGYDVESVELDEGIMTLTVSPW